MNLGRRALRVVFACIPQRMHQLVQSAAPARLDRGQFSAPMLTALLKDQTDLSGRGQDHDSENGTASYHRHVLAKLLDVRDVVATPGSRLTRKR